MENEFYPEIGKYYDTDAGDFDRRYWNNPVLQQIRQSFREEVQRHSFTTILEVGCGTGMDLVHFALTNPEAGVFGIDISDEMVRITQHKINEEKLANAHAVAAKVEDLPNLFPTKKFDLIYVFFGALNTVKNLKENADILRSILNPGGRMVLTFVNKWYLGGMILELARFRFSRAFARIRPVWGGYSPAKYLPSRCYSPKDIRAAFEGFSITNHHGYSIVHPAWYFTGINRKLGRIRRILWNADEWLNRTFLWRFGEYTLFTFQQRDRSA